MISPTPSDENFGPKTAIAADRVPMEVGVRACSNGLGRSSDGSGIGFLLIVNEHTNYNWLTLFSDTQLCVCVITSK